jgi:hypothetical protein
MVVPNQVERSIDELNEGITDSKTAWKIEIISPTGISGSYFIDKLKYYETLKVRAFGFPERSILEGQYGTKAEAGEHSDFALTGVELRHQETVMIINWHLVNQMLEYNYGPSAVNTVKVVPNKLVDEKKKVLKDVYDKILLNGNLILEERDAFDMSAIREQLDIPEREDYDEDERIPVILQPQGEVDENEDDATNDDSAIGSTNITSTD